MWAPLDAAALLSQGSQRIFMQQGLGARALNSLFLYCDMIAALRIVTHNGEPASLILAITARSGESTGDSWNRVKVNKRTH